RGAAQAFNPRTGTYAQTRQGSGVYGSWGSTQVQRGDSWASTKRFTDSAGNTTRVTRGENGAMINRRGEGFVGKQGDNVYAGRDGNAYRRDANGNWSKWENGGWNSTREGMLNDSARQRERQNRTGDGNGARGDRAGQTGSRALDIDRSTSHHIEPQNRTGDGNGARGDRAGQTGSRASTIDRSTYNNLNRDNRARREGAQRAR